jgi:hypothetical protein
MDNLSSDLLNYVICPLLQDEEQINLMDCNKNMSNIKACFKLKNILNFPQNYLGIAIHLTEWI